MCAIAASRVLVVEDDGTVRGFLGRALESGGYVPVPVRTGEEALQVLHAQRGIAAALIDGLLPDMHGVRLADAILDSPKGQSVAICFVSGAVHDPKAGAGGVSALGKPVRVAELLTAVDALVQWRRGGGSPPDQRRAALRHLEQEFLVGP
ncbi:MAG: response regulator transcription factor [Chloroflexi bacterium]|nr:MAG: response regulator transcription factor [Chloroflexota bacterium]TMF14067.1 MAG: response regulator transcription factor [Chloroflexota bacterium]